MLRSFATCIYKYLSVTAHIIALLHVGLINFVYSISHGMWLYQVIMTLHFLTDVVNDIESS